MMTRTLYSVMLRLHPEAFRERFGEEMMDIFDAEAPRGIPFRLFADVLVSLVRQRAFRPAGARPLSAGAALYAGPFQTLPTQPLKPVLFLYGVSLSLLLFAGVTSGAGHSRGNAGFLFGSRYPRTAPVPVNRATLQDAEPTTEVKITGRTADASDSVLAAYFRAIRVLSALDMDGDLGISGKEMEVAPASLRKLDRDGDGGLNAEECGFSLGPDAKVERSFVLVAQRRFMRGNPVLRALDQDGDAMLSAKELAESAGALQSLDANHDGALTEFEILPRVR